MGGYDVYCAICGGPFHGADDDEYEDLEPEYRYDREIANTTTTAWLERALVMGENPTSGSMSKIFVSGPAREHDAAYFRVEPSDDPNFPADKDYLRMYDKETDYPLAIPFHDSCYDLLQAKIGATVFRKDVLYHTFANHLQQRNASVLDIEWDARGEAHQQYFMTHKGEEYMVLEPTNIPVLQAHYTNLPRIQTTNQLENNGIERQRSLGSMTAFAKLPTEILLLLIDMLPLRELLALRNSSAVVYDLELTNTFWRSRIARDMPWLYDIPAEAWKDDAIDWVKTYKDLFATSQCGHQDCAPALLNRRRIWTTQDQIMDTYFAELLSVSSTTSAVLEDAQAGSMPLLIWPEPSHTQRALVGLLSDFEEMPSVQPRISVHWNATRQLSGLAITSESTTTTSLDIIGSTEYFARAEEFVLPTADWIREITLVSKAVPGKKASSARRHLVGIGFSFGRQKTKAFGEASGDQRVLRPRPGHVIVGFMGAYSTKGRISKLALVEQPRNRFQANCPRLAYGTGTPRDTRGEALLWRSKIPDTRLIVEDYRKGYWSHDLVEETFPMETLIFAETDAEWASITSISGDMHMGGFKIEYSGREARSIGPRFGTMRSKKIDGAGGERIACIVAYPDHIVGAIRFITNRGRQLLLGLIGPNQTSVRYEASQSNGTEVVGMYCSWLDRSLPTSQLETIGGLSTKSSTHIPLSTPDGSFDSQGFIWDPLPLPDSLIESGRLWGEWYNDGHLGLAGDPRQCPSAGSVVSWLDCSRAVAEVEVVSCHPERHRLNVVGVALTYADGERERVAVGYTELMPKEASEAAELEDYEHWCQCRRGESPPYEDKAKGPHIWSDRWKPAEERLQALHVWLDKHGALSGMHFVDGAGHESPLWGFDHCPSGGTHGAIDFAGGGSDECAKGVKFYLNNNQRHVTYNDLVVVGLQAVGKAE